MRRFAALRSSVNRYGCPWCLASAVAGAACGGSQAREQPQPAAQSSAAQASAAVEAPGRFEVGLVACDSVEEDGPEGPMPRVCNVGFRVGDDSILMDSVMGTEPPQLFGDSVWAGFAFVPATGVTALYEFHLRTRRWRYRTLADRASDFTMSPTGAYVAYVQGTDSGATGVVLRVSDLNRVMETPFIRLPATDVTVTAVRWDTPEALTILMQSDSLFSGPNWLRFQVAMPGGRWTLDTIRLP